ncbi:MAG: dipeptidyl-peptidase III [Ignavibacteria bacterium]|nr:MAG: dipeptidyl-peptidase III [Ignavibacteria bacterium]KAF0161557.1 MAG: dipeptidyl-peptidase III [Ignavibacteria bacterium]
MTLSKFLIIILIGISIMSCSDNKKIGGPPKDFKYSVESFADLRIQRYYVPGFEELTPKQKELVYYLYQASLSGRDIIYDQNYKHNLYIRRSLEAIVKTYNGDRSVSEFQQFMTYVKRVWFSNGIHHHYSSKKLLPEFSEEYLQQLLSGSDEYELPMQNQETVGDLYKNLVKYIFDPTIAPMKVNQADGVDLVKSSAVNFYGDVTQKEVEDFYKNIIDPNDPQPISYGLNSKLVKEDGKIFERYWRTGSMYAFALRKVVYWLEKAVTVAENDQQKKCFELLIEYYKTGDLKKWDEYNIEWVKDTSSVVEFTNGFIETYNDPLGFRANYESIVSIKDNAATKRIETISKNAQWFEDNSPIAKEHKKPSVKGISAKVITAVVEAGDAAPSTPIGINLPNANWIRKEHGSKSVNLGNIVHSYNKFAETSGVLQEFAYSKEEIEREKKYGTLVDDLHTDMHEVIGHASGQLNSGTAEPHQTLKNYYSTLEEARADLVALYFLYDQKLVDLGLIESTEAGKAAYSDYIRNGMLVQLSRVQPGDNIEQAHMRNRQLVSKWAFETGKKENVIEKKVENGKTYFVVNDYEKLKSLFGQLLKEIQRIKSEGDYNAGKNLVENYAVKVDQELHKEVLKRYKKLGIAPYAGFIQPKLVPVMEGKNIIDVKIEYPEDFTKQMLEYGKEYNLLTTYN